MGRYKDSKTGTTMYFRRIKATCMRSIWETSNCGERARVNVPVNVR